MASSSSSMLQPTSFGGYGRQTGAYGGLEGVEFAARCPPDVQKGTRIVAVCGIPGHRAAPQDDGWFFSDFFLFHQLLGSQPEPSNQLWLSCCSPSDLIRKHTRYLHGPADGFAGHRRVVMDEKFLPQNEMKAGFRVCEPKDLLERFLATLKSEIKEAAQAKQPVLVLIFGHGQETTSGIFIGCDQGGSWVLNQARLASVLQKDVQTTMVLTSCYSGGWIMKPNCNEYFDAKPRFNHSFLTAAGFEDVSISWPLSRTVGRQAGGSIFATCLLNAMITASDRTEGFYSGERISVDVLDDHGKIIGVEQKLIKVHETDEGEEDTSLSMVALAQQIRHECEERYGTLWGVHNFSFAAQDDLWAQAWGKRTGIPLLKYKEKWESLPEAPQMTMVYQSTGSLAGSFMSRSPMALHNIVKAKAARYMNSKPGPDNGGCNTSCHPRFHRLIEGAIFDADDLYELDETLDYRQGQMGLAEIYCYALGIGIPEGRQVDQFDEMEWMHVHFKAQQQGSTDNSKAAANLLKRFTTIRSSVIRLRIFDPPAPGQGFDYTKPKAYLAARLAESPISVQQIQTKLEDLLQYKLEEARRTARSPLGAAILNQPEIKGIQDRLSNTVGKLTNKLRSLSPKRSPRKKVGSQEGPA